MGDAVDLSGTVPVLYGGGLNMVSLASIIGPALDVSNGNATKIIALTSRIATLEGKPAPVVHFSTSITPGLLSVGSKVFTATVKGILAQDFMAAEPVAALPSGVFVGYVRAPAADTVEFSLNNALVAITIASPITLLLVALR